MENETKIIVSRYTEDVSWLKDYPFDHVIYNKGPKIEGDYNVLDVENIGNNQRDIFEYIYNNYDNLPSTMAFVQGNPFDHCPVPQFNERINNTTFTELSYLPNVTANQNTQLSPNGVYMEHNNSWYVMSHNNTWKQTCQWGTFDDFMLATFKNYTKEYWVTFVPGSQYIITRDIAKFYSKTFWKYLMDILHKNNMTEGHIIERSLWMIFNCTLEPIDSLK